jgi:hypothetical protein
MNNSNYQPLVIQPDMFQRLYDLPIGEFVESRMSGAFAASYLSWAHAVRLLKEHLPSVCVSFERCDGGIVHKHDLDAAQNLWNAYVMPYLTDGECRTPAIYFPVMDNRFRALECPDARAVNDAIQRGAVKAIATFTGLGLKLYAGEDIPSGPQVTDEVRAIVDSADRVEPLVEEPKPKAKPKAKKAQPKPKEKEGESTWGDAVIPFGKNKGKKLSELKSNSLQWYFENYEADPNFPDNQKLRDALDNWHKETQAQPSDIEAPDEFTKQSQETINEMENKPIDEIAEQGAGDPTDPDLDEEVPF